MANKWGKYNAPLASSIFTAVMASQSLQTTDYNIPTHHFQLQKRLYIHKCLFICQSVLKTPKQLEIIILHPSSFWVDDAQFIISQPIFLQIFWRENKLKSLKVAKWRKDEWRVMMKDEWRKMKDDDFKLLRGFGDRRTNKQTNRHLWL